MNIVIIDFRDNKFLQKELAILQFLEIDLYRLHPFHLESIISFAIQLLFNYDFYQHSFIEHLNHYI